MGGTAANYPEHRIVDVGLKDGSTIRIRPVHPEDAYDVLDLLERLSTRSRRMRFHGVVHPDKAAADRFTRVDYSTTFGLVAETSRGDEPRVVALGNYVQTQPGKAEVALVVDDPFHGRGLGSILLEHLGEAAVEAGLETFEAEVLSGNVEMLDVLKDMELPVEKRLEAGIVHAEFPTSLTREGIEAFERRERIASAAGVRAVLEPRSIAVVGASRERGTIGGELFRNLLDMGFSGPVYPVNPKAEVVQSVAAYPTVTAIPGPVDLAVIVVPAQVVLSVAAECAEKGVRALLVISAGFSETGEEGAERQNELLELARRHGMHIVGPNCMGVMNLDPAVRMNASFAPFAPEFGPLAFSSQSGALGIAVIDRTRELGLGMSSFVSVGNKADISGNDLLQYWEQDPHTKVILLYLESFGNPRKFARIARRIAKDKPIVAVKSGRSKAGARAAASHTGSLAAGDVAVDALFQQAGVIRTNTLEELFDVAALLAHQPLPSGRRVGILTNAGGLGILCADACEAGGLSVPSLSSAATAALRELLPAEASVGNPVDMIASASAEDYGRALELMCADDGLDAVIVIFIPPLVTRAEDVAEAISAAGSKASGTTVLTCFLGVQGIHERLASPNAVIPSYAFPEAAAGALARVADHAAWRARPQGSVREFDDIDRRQVKRYAAELLLAGQTWLSPADVSSLLARYGIRSPKSISVSSVDEVERAAAEIGGTVVLKIESPTILHKTDVGGVRVGLSSPAEAERAAQEMRRELERRNLTRDVTGFLVQEMVVVEGPEMFVGVTNDPSFGPLIACGAGGTRVELLRDVQVRITPLADVDAAEMLRALKTFPLLEGYRGDPPTDIAAVEDLLLRISQMVEDLPQLAELDLNPVIPLAPGEGTVVVDARIRFAVPQPVAPRGARSTRR